jgi:hypothetical protein
MNQEKDITSGMNQELESSFRKSKKLDRQIARTIGYNISPLKNIPILNKLFSTIIGVKPLKSLEYALKLGLNKSLVNLSKIGRNAGEEQERIKELEYICEQAREENWNAERFMGFIEDNTDINFNVEVDGQSYDFKELVGQVDSAFLTENEEEGKEWYDWIENHVAISKKYLESMKLLCLIGGKWVGGMSRNYFDLTQLSGGMEQMRKTLRVIGNGAQASMSTQQAIQEYGTVYVNGMKALVDGYKKLTKIRKEGSNNFGAAIDDLRTYLNTGENKKIAESTSSKFKLK